MYCLLPLPCADWSWHEWRTWLETRRKDRLAHPCRGKLYFFNKIYHCTRNAFVKSILTKFINLVSKKDISYDKMTCKTKRVTMHTIRGLFHGQMLRDQKMWDSNSMIYQVLTASMKLVNWIVVGLPGEKLWYLRVLCFKKWIWLLI